MGDFHSEIIQVSRSRLAIRLVLKLAVVAAIVGVLYFTPVVQLAIGLASLQGRFMILMPLLGIAFAWLGLQFLYLAGLNAYDLVIRIN